MSSGCESNNTEGNPYFTSSVIQPELDKWCNNSVNANGRLSASKMIAALKTATPALKSYFCAPTQPCTARMLYAGTARNVTATSFTIPGTCETGLKKGYMCTPARAAADCGAGAECIYPSAEMNIAAGQPVTLSGNSGTVKFNVHATVSEYDSSSHVVTVDAWSGIPGGVTPSSLSGNQFLVGKDVPFPVQTECQVTDFFNSMPQLKREFECICNPSKCTQKTTTPAAHTGAPEKKPPLTPFIAACAAGGVLLLLFGKWCFTKRK